MSPERIRRNDDEKLYQPRVHSRHIRALHRISEELGDPMTVLVDQALDEFIERYRQMLCDEWTMAFAEKDQLAPAKIK